MYKKQDLLRTVFTSLMDGTLQDKTNKQTDAETGLLNTVLLPFFKFNKKYAIFSSVECASVTSAECVEVFNKLLNIYYGLYAPDKHRELNEVDIVALLTTCGVETRYSKAQNGHRVYINKKVFDILRDVAE